MSSKSGKKKLRECSRNFMVEHPSLYAMYANECHVISKTMLGINAERNFS